MSNTGSVDRPSFRFFVPTQWFYKFVAACPRLADPFYSFYRRLLYRTLARDICRECVHERFLAEDCDDCNRYACVHGYADARLCIICSRGAVPCFCAHCIRSPSYSRFPSIIYSGFDIDVRTGIDTFLTIQECLDNVPPSSTFHINLRYWLHSLFPMCSHDIFMCLPCTPCGRSCCPHMYVTPQQCPYCYSVTTL